jgi:hypothetical protein
MPATDQRVPVHLGAIPLADLGHCLNLVARPAYPCPTCSERGPMGVYGPAVRWVCGHTRTLPPLPSAGRSGLIVHLHPRKAAA